MKGDWHDHLDFWRIEPPRGFYLLRAIDDDIVHIPSPKKLLDFEVLIWRVAETIVVGKRFAEALKFDPDTTRLYFIFHWNGLLNRRLSSWTNPHRMISSQPTRQDEIEAFIKVPLSIADNALNEYVEAVVSKVFILFNGFELPSKTVKDIFLEMLNRGRT